MNLLVSVRSVEEALAALEGGGDLIDIKEPERGALGKADDAVIAAIVDAVAGRRPVSAAMGELRDAENWQAPAVKLDYVKFGLAGCQEYPWRKRLLELRASTDGVVVPTAYADWERAVAPPVGNVAEFVLENQFPVLLIDTCEKDGRNLFSWLSRDGIRQSIGLLRDKKIQVALAGSITERDFEAISDARPAWVAVRGAVCDGENRQSKVSLERVRNLKALLDTIPRKRPRPARTY